MFADDLLVIKDTERKPQLALHKLDLVHTTHDVVHTYTNTLIIYITKTKTMAFLGWYPVRTKVVAVRISYSRTGSLFRVNFSRDRQKDVDKKLAKFVAICGTITWAIKRKTQ